MSPPPAVLNVEEMHWQSDLGLPNQRRWLNHRNIGDEHRRTFPSAAGIVTQIDYKIQMSWGQIRISNFRSQIGDRQA
jgi:hypothetical protein